MKKVTIMDLLKNGVHFGHQAAKWHPRMKPYIFTTRSGVHIINLEKTLEHLESVTEMLKNMAAEGKTILFVGTKRQAKEIVKKYAVDCDMPYITERWLGGLFTNFVTVSRLMRKLTKLKAQKESGQLDKYTKKEQVAFGKEIAKLEKFVGGIENMNKLPDVVFVVGVREEKTAIREASKKRIPILAIVDTNVNPDDMKWIIAGNDDATKSLELIVSAVSEAIKDGRANLKVKMETKPEIAPKTVKA